MDIKLFLIKYSEIAIKGKNCYMFEDMLVHQIVMRMKAAEGQFSVTKTAGRIYVEALTEYDYDEVIGILTKIFGIVGICPIVQVEDNGIDALCADVVAYMQEKYGDKAFTFKVMSRRARKNYPILSNDVNAKLGEAILMNMPNSKVNVHDPDLYVYVEIREKINIYTETIKGAGGMPLGSNGKSMLLLSGGIDSPVAGYMVSKRGVTIEAVYFHAPPYTSERAKQKVVDLAKQVAKYAGPINLHIINFTDIQLKIYEKCPKEELTIIMRRYMMRIAERLASRSGCLALVTGESIGQVASQTVQSLVCTNEVCTLPVFRPLIALDKQEIITISERIGTYETSIEPYEDCCTIFVAKHPVTRPVPEQIRKSEAKVLEELEAMVETAINTKERILCNP